MWSPGSCRRLFQPCFIGDTSFRSPLGACSRTGHATGLICSVSLLPPDTGRGGERLCAPQPAQCPRGRAGAGWLGAAVPRTTALPHGRALGSPPQLSPGATGRALLGAAPGRISYRCEQRLPDIDGVPWEFTSQSLAVAGRAHLPCPSHCDGGHHLADPLWQCASPPSLTCISRNPAPVITTSGSHNGCVWSRWLHPAQSGFGGDITTQQTRANLSNAPT